MVLTYYLRTYVRLPDVHNYLRPSCSGSVAPLFSITAYAPASNFLLAVQVLDSRRWRDMASELVKLGASPPFGTGQNLQQGILTYQVRTYVTCRYEWERKTFEVRVEATRLEKSTNST